MSEERELQFEQAEFLGERRSSGTQCDFCQQPIAAEYFQVNEQVACARCRGQLEEALYGGSPAGRFVRASAAGVLASAVGAGIYFAILALTGYHLGIVAVVVGLLVGGAVRWGCNRRGGWAYQTLAIALTYSSIVVTYIPMILEAVEKQAATEAEGEETAEETTEEAGGAEATSSTDDPPLEDLGVLGFLIGVVVLFVFAAAVPILAGVQNVIGLLIIGFALFEAWKMNKRPTITIRGPLSLASGGGGAVSDG